MGAAVQTADLEIVADFVRAVADPKKERNEETSISAETTPEPAKADAA